MRSCILTQYSLEDAVMAYPWQARPDDSTVAEKLHLIALKYKYYEKAEVVAAGDVVTITMTADHKKFNRTTKLQVGSNMFDKDLETALIGKTADTDYVLDHAVGQVKYRISDIQRLVVPEVTDEMAAKAGIDGVATVADLHRHYILEGLKGKLWDEVYEFLPTYLDRCEFTVEEADLEEMDEAEMERCRGISRSMNMVFDEMTEDQLLGAVGCPNIPEFRKMIHGYHGKTLRAMLAEAAIRGEDPEPLTYQDANPYYGALLDRINQCAMNKIMEE